MQKQVLRGGKNVLICWSLSILKCPYGFSSFVFTVLLKPWSQLNGSFRKKPFMVEVKTGQTALSQAATQVMKEIQGHNSTLYILWDFYKFYEPNNRSIGSLCRFFLHPKSAHPHNRFLQQGRKNQVLKIRVYQRTFCESFWSNSCELKIAFSPIPIHYKYFRIFLLKSVL